MLESSRDGVLYYSRILKFENAKLVFKKVFERFYVFKCCPFLSNVVLLKRTTFENLWKTSKRFLKGSRSLEVFQRFFRGFWSTFFVYVRCIRRVGLHGRNMLRFFQKCAHFWAVTVTCYGCTEKLLRFSLRFFQKLHSF